VVGAAVRYGAVALAVAVSVALGCGAPPPPPDPAPEPEPVAPVDEPDHVGPCSLLTVTELEEALGEAVLDGVENTLRCVYGRPPNEAGYSEPAVTVRLEFSAVDPLTLLATYQATLRSALGEYEPVPVQRVGDAAVWDGSAMVTAVAIDTGGSAFVSVQLHDTDLEPDAQYDVVLALIRQAVTRVDPEFPPPGRGGRG